MRRFTCGALLLGTVAVLAAGGSSLVLAWNLLGCYTDLIGLQQAPICYASLWGHPTVPKLVLAACTAAVLVLVIQTVRSSRRQVGGARRLQRELASATVPNSPRLAHVAAAVGLDRVTQTHVPQPIAITVGLHHPTVIVTSGLVELLDDEELAAVLHHEQEHQQSRHPLIFVVARAAAVAAVALPVAAHWARRATLEGELLADRHAVSFCGERPLASALLKIASHIAGDGGQIAVGSIAGDLATRLDRLLGQPHSHPPRPAGMRIQTTLGLLLCALPVLTILYVFSATAGVL